MYELETSMFSEHYSVVPTIDLPESKKSDLPPVANGTPLSWASLLHQVSAHIENGRSPHARELFRQELTTALKEMYARFHHSTAHTIHFDSHRQIKMCNDLYVPPELSLQAERAIKQATIELGTHHPTSQRYSLELNQILQTELKLTHFFALHMPNFAQVHLENLVNSSSTTDVFDGHNWKQVGENKNTTDPLLTSYIRQQHNLPHINTFFAGPRYFFIMPHSPIHAHGETAMYVFVQPVFLPNEQKFLAVQHQYMIPTDQFRSNHNEWQLYFDQLLRLLPKLQAPQNLTESYFFTQVFSLPPDLSQLSPQLFFKVLLQPEISQLPDIAHQELFEQLLQDLPLFYSFIQKILKWEQKEAWTAATSERVWQALLKVLSSLEQGETITSAVVNQWIEDYKKIFSKPSANENPWQAVYEHMSLSLSLTPWLANPVGLSQLECVIFSFKGLPISKLSFQNLVRGGITDLRQLNSFIGRDRAKNWKLGICSHAACQVTNLFGLRKKQFIGECGWCLDCEQRDATNQNDTQNTEMIKSSNESISDIQASLNNSPSVGLGQFISGEFFSST